MTMTTPTATSATMIGYMAAFLMMALSLALFSKCDAIRLNAISSFPEASPADTIFTMISGNTSGYFAIALASVSPFPISALAPPMAFAITLFSVCSSSMARESTIVTPASIMLTICRQNTLKSRGFTALPICILISLLKIFAFSTEIGVISIARSFSYAASTDDAVTVPRFSLPYLSMALYVYSSKPFSF